ncbi:hypothetical protein [Synechococcus sp. PCC 7336]|nr:hypothetical protein [Synechococcus sp. PCC 7336]
MAAQIDWVSGLQGKLLNDWGDRKLMSSLNSPRACEICWFGETTKER